MTPTRAYPKEDITVEWYPELCIHCQECVNGLPEVFNLEARPWVNVEAATKDKIVEQVNKCPPQALRIK